MVHKIKKKYYFEELDENIQESIFDNVSNRLSTIEEADNYITSQDKMTKEEWLKLR